ncbi:MAG TPA: M14 family zinc carboxypeptidase [Candidatus Limnocylindrales bacterium]
MPLLRSLLAVLLALALLPLAALPPAGAVRASGFPAGYEDYHDYAEMVAELDRAVADHPSIVRKFSIGRSYEGRQLWAAKISDNVNLDEDEPEALFDSLIHAREHLTVEMNLYLLHLLTDGYGSDARITDIVDTREIFLIFMLNPDGGEFDIAGDEFAFWRKNRQPIPGSTQVGIDPNRNFGFKWGCCNGSSGKPRDETYRGWAPWVAPEVQAYRDFIRSRVVGGRQQIRVAISWHTSSELILWPYGYTDQVGVRTMTTDDRRAFEALGTAMAEMNGYTPHRSYQLYPTDGDQTSWSHYEQRIFHFTFEMFPSEIDFYPLAKYIPGQTARNREAVLYLLEQAACPYRAAGLDATLCGPLADDFEISRGWTVNPYGTDTARRGRWQRGLPARTSDGGGAKQQAFVPSGQSDFATGLGAGRSAAAKDLDGGVTSLLSPAFRLAPGGSWRLFFRSYLAHNSRATAADYLRVSVVDGASRTVLWSTVGKRQNRNATWSSRTVNLDAFAGRTVRLLFEAADGARDNLVEAALDDVRVYAPTAASLLTRPAGATPLPAVVVGVYVA